MRFILRHGPTFRFSLKALIATVTLLPSFEASALRDLSSDRLSFSGNDDGAAVVYSFDETGSSSVLDRTDTVGGLSLNMSTEGNLPTGDGTPILTNASIQNGILLINPKPNNDDNGYQSAQRHRTFLVSPSAAAKLNSCDSTGFTIQVIFRPHFPFQGNNSGNMIVGLSNSSSTALAVPNFALYQTGDLGAESVTLEVRTGATTSRRVTSIPGAFSSVREGDNAGRLTEVIATQERAGGDLTVYVNRVARSLGASVSAAFNANARLVIGNELVHLRQAGDGTTRVADQRNWSGEIYHVAIYCRGFNRTEILGSIVNNKSRAQVVRPQLTMQISSTRTEARKLVERLTGTIVPIDHPMVTRVEQRLVQGDRLGAAKIVTGDLASGEPGHPDFLNTVVKQFALRMSNREETIRVPLNDFAASFIGVTRDERNAQELLTGNFFYIANPTMAKVPSDLFKDILTSNRHFEELERGQWDLGKVLMRVPGSDNPPGLPTEQHLPFDPFTGATKPNPDPAGVITSRAFMEAHATAGTNRRLVEYSFRAFMCMPMSEMADTSASPARIGRDVDRMPAGDNTKFETSCKGCHTVMDGFRGAFAKWDFKTVEVNNTAYAFALNTQVHLTTPFGFNNGEVDEHGTVRKMNHNENVFPTGFTISDESFINNAVGPANRKVFGWAGSNKGGGFGVNQFGRILADSTRFSQCMAKRAYETVCTLNTKTSSQMSPLIDGFAEKFRNSGYNLKALFQDVASNSACAAGMAR